MFIDVETARYAYGLSVGFLRGLGHIPQVGVTVARGGGIFQNGVGGTARGAQHGGGSGQSHRGTCFLIIYKVAIGFVAGKAPQFGVGTGDLAAKLDVLGAVVVGNAQLAGTDSQSVPNRTVGKFAILDGSYLNRGSCVAMTGQYQAQQQGEKSCNLVHSKKLRMKKIDKSKGG